MKKNLKKTILTISLLLSIGYGSTAFSHSQGGSLGLGAGNTDLYQVNCFDDGDGAGPTHHLKTSVRTGVAPVGLKISVRTQRLAKATNTTDAINGDGFGSPFVSTVSGDGVYYMTVAKTIAHTAPVSYSLNFHCESISGGHTGTTWFKLQDQ